MSKEVKNTAQAEETTEMMVVNRNDIISGSAIHALTDTATAFFSSIADNGTRESKVAIYNAINKADEKLDDHKNEVLNIKDVVAHTVTLIDENTSEVIDCTRIVLINDKGVGYESISVGIYSSLQKLFAIVGMPTWDEPLKVKCVEQKTRKGFKTLTLELV